MTLAITSKKEGKLLLRKTEGIKDWQKILDTKIQMSKDRTGKKVNDEFWLKKQKSDSHDIQGWIMARNRIGNNSNAILLS